MKIRFSDYSYYPSLRTRPSEMEGYKNLGDPIKNGLLPLMILGAWPRQNGLDESIQQMRQASDDRPVIVDLTKETLYQNDGVHTLLDSADNFRNWRRCVEALPNAVPVVQFTSDARLPQIIRQTRLLESSGINRLAFRISDYINDTNRVITAMSAMDSPQNALIIIDAGYVRETMAASIAACITSVNEIRDEIPSAEITVLSTSFPASVTSFVNPSSRGMSGVIGILERELHEAIGADAVIYGDHASIHARTKAATGGKYTPHIDCALVDAWVFERRPNSDSQGYIEAAQAIIEACPECLEDDTWGADAIRRAASGNINGLKMRSAWIAVRVNMHLTRQFELSSGASQNATDEDEEDF